MTRGVRTAAVTAILLLTVASCRNGEARGNNPLPPLSGTPTPTDASRTGTPSPSAKAPVDPKVALRAFVRDYFAEMDRAGATGDTSRLRELTLDGCDCLRPAEVIDRAYKTGSIRGMRHVVDSIEFQYVGADEAGLVVGMHASGYTLLDENGHDEKRLPPIKRALLGHTLQRVGSEWRLARETVVVLEQ